MEVFSILTFHFQRYPGGQWLGQCRILGPAREGFPIVFPPRGEGPLECCVGPLVVPQELSCVLDIVWHHVALSVQPRQLKRGCRGQQDILIEFSWGLIYRGLGWHAGYLVTDCHAVILRFWELCEKLIEIGFAVQSPNNYLVERFCCSNINCFVCRVTIVYRFVWRWAT